MPGPSPVYYGPAALPEWPGAACAAPEAEGLVWVPESEMRLPEDRANVRACKAVCGGCALRAQCLAWALAHTEAGIWGGTSTEERRQMRAGASPCGRCRAIAEFRAAGLSWSQVADRTGIQGPWQHVKECR